MYQYSSECTVQKMLAVIGDMVGSKRIGAEERAQVQQRLAEVLGELNNRCAEMLISPYTLTLGDEFQAVFHRADAFMLDAFSIQLALHPVQVRFAFGVGEITTAINPTQALGMDGPAFHYARDGITALKCSDCLFAVQGLPVEIQLFVQHSLDLLSHQLAPWGALRLRILTRLYQQYTELEGGAYGKGLIADIAGQVGITERAVYKHIKAGALKTVIALCNDLAELVNDAMREEKP